MTKTKISKNPESTISTDKVYEMAVLTLHHTENRIETINKHYTSIFFVIFAAIPFLYQVVGKEISVESRQIISVVCLVCSVLLSLYWDAAILSLENYIESIHKSLVALEKNSVSNFRGVVSKDYNTSKHSVYKKSSFEKPYLFALVMFLICVAMYNLK